jgi:hypothetical protein
VKFTIEQLDPDDAEKAFLRKADLRRAELVDLTLNMLWSRVGLTHDGFAFDGYGFAIGYLASILDVAENLARLLSIEVVLDESGDCLRFEMLNQAVRIAEEGKDVTVEFTELVTEFREFALGTMAGIVRSHPGLEDNPEIVSLIRRIKALRGGSGS